MKPTIYLDNSQTTEPSAKAIACMLPFLTEKWGLNTQPHKKGEELQEGIKIAFTHLWKFFKAQEEDEVLFVSSSAEAVNQVIQGTYFEGTLHTGKNHFIGSKADEAPAIMALHRLEQAGCPVTFVIPSVKNITEAITPRTALVSLSWGHGLTGVIQPIKEISQVLKERGIKFHLEASHVMGKLWFDPRETGADYISFGGDLIHGPKSSGALWIKSTTLVPKLILGGIEQGGFRAGPVDVASLAGLGEAAREAQEGIDFMSTEVARLRSKLEREILKQIPQTIIQFRDQERLPHISCISFIGCSSEALLYLLNREGVLASMGGGSLQQVGYVLSSLGVSEKESASALSFSLSNSTTDDEIDRTVIILKEACLKLRKLSEGLQ